MHRITFPVLVAAVLIAAPAGGAEPKAPDPETLAAKLVKEVARIRDGDLVQIVGGPNESALLESLAVHVRKQGGHPLVVLKTGRLFRRLIEDVPAKLDTQTPEFERKVAEIMQARIVVESGDFDLAGVGLPADRLSAAAKATQPIDALLLRRNVRQVSLGNALYPTAERARVVGLSHEKLAELFWNGVNADYTALQATAERVRKVMAEGKEVRLTHPNGTDVKLRIEKRPVFVSDGVLSAEKEKRGGAACQAWLPAGEVYVTPVADSAEGTVVLDRVPLEDKEVTGLKLTFKAGRLTKMEAKSGLERLQAMYDAAGAGRDVFAFLDVGVNPNVKLPPDTKVFAWMAAGAMTVGVGRNDWAGGDSNSPFGAVGQLSGATLTIDGRVVIERGELKP